MRGSGWRQRQVSAAASSPSNGDLGVALEQRAGRDEQPDRELDRIERGRAARAPRTPRGGRGSRRASTTGVNGTSDGRSGSPASRHSSKARRASARVCPFASCASTRSESDSTAVVANAAPSRRELRHRRRAGATRCSTLAVKSKVSAGKRAWSARATRSAWVGPFRKSGSPKVTCSAPAATCARDVREHDLLRDREEPAAVDAARPGSGGSGACSRASPRRSRRPGASRRRRRAGRSGRAAGARRGSGRRATPRARGGAAGAAVDEARRGPRRARARPRARRAPPRTRRRAPPRRPRATSRSALSGA